MLSLGFLGTFILNGLLKETYSSRKSELEESIENFLNKKVSLGDYSGIRFLGISLRNSKITDKKNKDSEIKSKSLYVGIMPFRSFLKQKWIVKIRPEQTSINIDRNFFKRDKSSEKSRNINKSKSKYDLIFKFNNYSLVNIKNSGLKTNIKGNVIYKSNSSQIIANLKSKFDEKGILKFKLNANLKKESLGLELFSRGLDLQNSVYNIGGRKISFKKGNFRSNFKLNKSSTGILCKGRFSFNNLTIKSEPLSEKINSESTSFFCKDNNLVGISENLNYGTLTSNFNLNIPLRKFANTIDVNGSIGYVNSLNPDIKLSGKIPYWLDKKGLNFGNIYSSFDINRTQLSNLNIFRKNDIRGFVTAKGELKGNINDPDILVNFNVDYPHYKGIRIRETWQGEIKNQNNIFLLNMKNRSYSTIPSYLSLKLDYGLKFDSLNFSRVFNSDKGSIEIIKEDDRYIWRADNFPLDQLELSISKNQFDRINGIINGVGSISSNLSFLEGRLAWSFAKYGNIKLANSLFDFSLKDDYSYINSSLYPIDGGIIEIEYNTSNNKLVNVDFNDISTNWTILTAFNIFNFDNKKVLPTSKFNVLDDLEISIDNSSFKERMDFINRFNKNKNNLNDKFNLQEYINKFSSRYNGKLTIEGDRPLDYKLNAKLNGFIDVSRDNYKNNKQKFSIELEGGLLRGEGSLKINNLPLSSANIFLNQPRDFLGGLDMNLIYNLDKKSFSSEISSNNSSIKNNKIVFDKGIIEFANSIFDIDFSILTNESKIPLNIKGEIPTNKIDNLDVRLSGNGKIFELIENFTDDFFTFKKGDLNLRMIIKGTINKPILNGFIVIKDSEIDLYSNIIKDINSSIIFDFESLQIENLQAMSEDSGKFLIKGFMPFYQSDSRMGEINLKTNKFNIKTDNLNFLLDSDVDLTGSFENLLLGGDLSLNNGFINFNSTNQNKEINNKNKLKEVKKGWPELYWKKNKNIEIISNETILNSFLLGETFPDYLNNLSFNNLNLKFGPNFRLQYSEIIKAKLDSLVNLEINGTIGKDLNARGLIKLSKGIANLYTTPFKLDKNKDNYILFASRKGIIPDINFSLVSKVPDSIIPISENSLDTNISGDTNDDANQNGFGAFGIGNSRLIRIEASYSGPLDQLSFEDENQRIKLRSTPSYNRSQIIGLIGGNSANLINRAFISQLNNADAFSERFQLSLYPTLLENNDSLNNIFSSENLDIENNEQTSSNGEFSSQAWVAELGLDITDAINFAFQAIPGRDDISPIGILTFQANPNLEFLGSYDTNGDWTSQMQLFFRY